MPLNEASTSVGLSALPVLLYDGECGLCNSVVRFLLKIDRRGVLHFAALQSPPAEIYLRSQHLPTSRFDSVIFVPDWHRPQGSSPRFQTDAALAALASVGGMGTRIATVLRVVPAPLRNGFYRLVARFRYRLFGPYRPRPLPNPAWNERFIR